MPTVQISDDVKDILDRLVANGIARSGAEFVELAVRRCAADLDYDEAELIAAAEAGLADVRAGNYTTIDGPESRTVFWDQIRREVREKAAEMRSGEARRKA
jgi:predicted transcriptional regulator